MKLKMKVSKNREKKKEGETKSTAKEKDLNESRMRMPRLNLKGKTYQSRKTKYSFVFAHKGRIPLEGKCLTESGVRPDYRKKEEYLNGQLLDAC